MSSRVSDEERIINALRKGIIPNANISQLCVGRENELKAFDESLNLIKMGGADLKFIKGNYGMGKSFLLKIMKEKAFNNDFVVSKITLSNSVRMNKIEDIYVAIATNIECKSSKGLKEILDRWYSKLRSRISIYYDIADEDIGEFIERESVKVLEKSREFNNSFANVVETYIKAKNLGDLEVENTAIAWLMGDKTLPAKKRKLINVKSTIVKENALNFLKALSSLLKSLDYNGLVILIDEAEFIINLRKDQRTNSYDYIRDIMDACGEDDFSSTLFVFAGTPEFFNDTEKGLKSYKGFDDRVKSYLSEEFSNSRQPIIVINGLTDSDLLLLGNKIIKIHENVYGWDSEGLISLETVINKSKELATFNHDLYLSRDFIRRLVEYLDSVQQHPDKYEEILNDIKGLNTNDEINEGWE